MTWPQFLRAECTVARQTVKLRPNDAKVLLALMLSPPDRHIPQSVIVESVWEPDQQPDYATRIVDLCVMRLRERRIMIETRWGYGFCLPARRRAPDRPHCLQPGRCKARTDHHCNSCATSARHAARTGLTPAEAELFHLIETNPPMTHPEMQRALGYRYKSNVQRLIEQMERRGFVVTSHSSHRSTRVKGQDDPALSATPNQRKALVALYQHPRIGMKELGGLLGCSRANATYLVERLIKHGLAMRLGYRCWAATTDGSKLAIDLAAQASV